MNGHYEIIRTRNFLEHSPDQITSVRTEYTIRNIDSQRSLDNIFLVYDKFLPNLHVTDSENIEYPIMSNSDTLNLLEHDGKDDDMARNMLSLVKECKKYVIWIKIPPNRKIQPNETRLLHLGYEKKKNVKHSPKHRNVPILLRIKPRKRSSVHFTLKKPKDYYIPVPESTKKGSNKKTSIRDDPSFHYDETDTSLTFFVESDLDAVVSYKPHVKRSVMLFPAASFAMLTILAMALLLASACLDSTLPAAPYCSTSPFLAIADHKIELLIFVVSSSLVIPQLFPNVVIRNRWSYVYLVPITCALLSLLY